MQQHVLKVSCAAIDKMYDRLALGKSQHVCIKGIKRWDLMLEEHSYLSLKRKVHVFTAFYMRFLVACSSGPRWV
jgi:hypothetical protein